MATSEQHDSVHEDEQETYTSALNELHRLRGAFLDKMASVEIALGTTIRVFFKIPVPRDHELRTWVLAHLSAAARIDFLAKATRASEHAQLGHLISMLRDLNAARNAVAHSSLHPIFPSEWTDGEPVLWTQLHTSRRAVRMERVMIDQVRAHVRDADFCEYWITLIMSELAEQPDGELPADIDWRERLAHGRDEDGIVTVSSALMNEFVEVTAEEWAARVEDPR